MSATISTSLSLSEENIKPHLFWWDTGERKAAALENFTIWGKTWALITGVICLGLGMAFAYRPSLLFVKNHLPFEYPYPIWQNSKQELSKPYSNLIPLRSLLTHKERIILSKYRYVLVSIASKRFLVEKNQDVPEDCIIIRTRSGNSICGL